MLINGTVHIFMQPADESTYLLADDLTSKRVVTDHKGAGKWKSGRMCVETSPSNFQVWLHSDRDLSQTEKEHWLKMLGSDPNAAPRGRWERTPGFRNRKDKRRNEQGWPLAKLILCDYRNPRIHPRGSARNPSQAIPQGGGVHAVSRSSEGVSRSD